MNNDLEFVKLLLLNVSFIIQPEKVFVFCYILNRICYKTLANKKQKQIIITKIIYVDCYFLKTSKKCVS